MSYVLKHFITDSCITALKKIDLFSFSFSDKFLFHSGHLYVHGKRAHAFTFLWLFSIKFVTGTTPGLPKKYSNSGSKRVSLQSHGDARFQFVGNFYKLIWGLELSAGKPGWSDDRTCLS